MALGVGGAALACPASAAPTLLQNDIAQVSVAPYADQAALGGRAVLDARLGAIETSLSTAFAYGGGGVGRSQDVWAALHPTAPWTSDDVRVRAGWALTPAASLSFEAGERARWTRDTLGQALSDRRVITDATRFLRLRAKASATDDLDLEAGLETTATALDTRVLGGGATTQLLSTSRRVFGQLSWRPWSHLTLQAGEAAQDLTVGWRGGEAASTAAAYLTPSVALLLEPWAGARWRLETEEAVSPISPAQFAAYAEIAPHGDPSAIRPDHGWRSALRLAQTLPGGVELSAEATDWRLASVTELGPVGAGEAPTDIVRGLRQQLTLRLAAPLSALGVSSAGLPALGLSSLGLPSLGLRGTTLAAEASLRRSRVIDPFTGQAREMSGEAPYAASLRLAGALAARDMTWSLVARADGPQSVYQMAQVTSLGASTGVGGAVTYGLGAVRMSLEVDNLVGGGRDVTTYSYAGPRALGALSEIVRRRDDARAVRFALRQPL
jgi:hypothetical protein